MEQSHGEILCGCEKRNVTLCTIGTIAMICWGDSKVQKQCLWCAIIRVQRKGAGILYLLVQAERIAEKVSNIGYSSLGLDETKWMGDLHLVVDISVYSWFIFKPCHCIFYSKTNVTGKYTIVTVVKTRMERCWGL